MTAPTPISQHAPHDEDQQQLEITDKQLIENVPLVITDANKRNSKQYGPFWLIEATRKDTGEVVAFVGSKVIDKLMDSVSQKKAFPVLAMIVKVSADNPQGYYWDLVDPPGTPAAAPTNGNAPSGRVSEIGSYIERKVITVDDVGILTKEIAGEPKKVNDLSDAEYKTLLERIAEIASSLESEPPF